MNAQPTRAFRPTTAKDDENAYPTAAGKITASALHQRYKSTGNIAAMATGLKAAAKRTAFGDLSNIIKTGEKNNGKPLDKVVVDVVAPAPATADIVLSTKEHVAEYVDEMTKADDLAFIEEMKAKWASETADAEARAAAKAAKPLNKPAQRGFRTMLNAAAPSYFPGQHQAQKKTTNVWVDGAPQAAPAVAAIAAPPVASTASMPTVQQDMNRIQPYGMVGPVMSMTVPVPVPVAVPVVAQFITPHDFVPHYFRMSDAQATHNNEHGNVTSQAAQVEELVPFAGQLRGPTLAQAMDDSVNFDEDLTDELINDPTFAYSTHHSMLTVGDHTTGGLCDVVLPKFTRRHLKEIARAKEITLAGITTSDYEDECWDTSMVAEYGEEIFEYMTKLEGSLLPDCHYMDRQPEMRWSMRAVLLEWVHQVHERFGLLPETLFLTVNYIDRFLSNKVVSLGKLQLVGAVALFVAAKYEEINCPSINEMVYMVDNGYTVEEILKAERFMLQLLNYNMGYPGPMSFLRRISKADDYDLETRTLAKYFLEVMMMDERFVGSPASFNAAGAHCLARLMLHKGDWHTYYSGYTWGQLYRMVCLLHSCLRDPERHHRGVFGKYGDRRYKKAAHFVQSELRKGFVVPPIDFHFASAPVSPGMITNGADTTGGAPESRMVQAMA